MTKTMINIKTDKAVKENAQRAARELGVTLSDVMNAALRNFIRTREVTFSAVPMMTPELERLIGPIEADLVAGRNLSPSFSSAEGAARYLHSK